MIWIEIYYLVQLIVKEVGFEESFVDEWLELGRAACLAYSGAIGDC